MKNFLLYAIVAAFISCSLTHTSMYNHPGAHHFEILIDTFYYKNKLYEVRQCDRWHCEIVDTFPNLKYDTLK